MSMGLVPRIRRNPCLTTTVMLDLPWDLLGPESRIYSASVIVTIATAMILLMGTSESVEMLLLQGHRNVTVDPTPIHLQTRSLIPRTKDP